MSETPTPATPLPKQREALALPPDSDGGSDRGSDPAELLRDAGELPVVARMVVEIRSDGIKTVARGAFEDFQTGQQVAVETDPLAAAKLAQAFTRSILGSTAGLVRLGVQEGLKTTARSLVPDPLRRLKRKLFGQEPPGAPPE